MQGESQPTPREPLSKRIILAHLATGVKVAGYVIEKPLGAGGMGQVYLALDERLGRKVALKILPPEDADDEARARFLREAKALARVEHQNVVRVFASGEDGETAWMALEVVDGEPLSSLASGDSLDEETSCALMAQVARGLAAVHAVGVVHRDVKPENLLVNNDAVVKIVDFGVALMSDPGSGGFTTRKGVVVGTPHFMSPEQARGATVDTRSDAWAVGATLYALLTARPPFFGSDSEPDLDILARVLREPVPDVRAHAPSTSPATIALLASLLEKEPEKRQSDMLATADALDAIAAALARGERPGDEAAVAPKTNSTTPSTTTAETQALALPTTTTTTQASRAPLLLLGSLLILVAVVGGAALGQVFVEPTVEVQQVVVEKRVEVPVEVKVPVEPPAPAPLPTTATPEMMARQVLDAPASHQSDLLGKLLARDDDDAKAALALVAAAPSSAGDALLARVDDDHRGDLPMVIEAALYSASNERSRVAIRMLNEKHDYAAFQVLSRAANTHKSAAIRAAAADARDSIFKVED